MRNYRHIFGLTLVLGASLASSKGKTTPKPQAQDPLASRSAEQVIKDFMFIADFDTKDETRPNAKEIFWRYPFTLPKIGFTFQGVTDVQSPQLIEEMPQTQGEGRAIQHLNAGRVLFLDGQIDEARKTWLSARSRYGTNYPYHRRADYFIAQSFLYLGLDLLRNANNDFNRQEVRQSLVNASTFTSWAYDRKKDIADPLLDRYAPRAYYNQAVIYYNYERWAGVVGAAHLGLDFLRKSGRHEYRRDLRRMLAETHIRNRDYLEAVRELDLTLRQDEGLDSAAAIFARIADVYFDLNNFELAEEVYGVAAKIDRELKFVRPSQFVLRGESLFWMGRFAEAIKIMEYAVHASSMPNKRSEDELSVMPVARDELDLNMQALASIRIADSWLALGNFEKAKLAYFQHAREFRQHITATSAKLRLACLELPEYEGNNIQHARLLLAELKDQADVIPESAQEMAWTCEMASFAQHERTPEMVDRVRTFAGRYPESSFLQKLVVPVREVQARHIDGYFKAGDAYGAVQFFEKTRRALFPEVSEDLAVKLFAAYVDIHQTEKARDFLEAYRKQKLDDFGWLRLATAMAEFGNAAEGVERSRWEQRNRQLGQEMLKVGLKLKYETNVRLKLNRIFASSMARLHFPWIIEMGLGWTESDISMGCDLVYPMFERLKGAGEIPDAVLEKAAAFIDASLQGLLRFETNCAYSIMEFELELHADKMSVLADKYLRRNYILMNPTTASLIWNVAEQSARQNYRPGAEALWKLLVDKGDPLIAEVRYARSRLDQRRTELESLWQN